MAERKACNNLGTSRTPRWPIIIKFLIGLVPREFNFRGIRLFGIFLLLDISCVLGVPRMGTWISKSQSWISEINKSDDCWSIITLNQSIPIPLYKYMHSTWEPNHCRNPITVVNRLISRCDSQFSGNSCVL